jgi:hypothetical protein
MTCAARTLVKTRPHPPELDNESSAMRQATERPAGLRATVIESFRGLMIREEVVVKTPRD